MDVAADERGRRSITINIFYIIIDIMMMKEFYECVVIGAGISGISASHYLNERGIDHVVLERRSAIGGTWDLFKYPGIRSDSDMYSFGFSFAPWKSSKVISPGQDILKYLKHVVYEFKGGRIGKCVKLCHNVVTMDFSSVSDEWKVSFHSDENGNVRKTIRSRFVFLTTGYYDYESPHDPYIKGEEDFEGILIHAQKWNGSIKYKGKHVAVIGSGATAATLVPSLANDGAESVTMVQRSPSYFAAIPSNDRIFGWLRIFLGSTIAFNLTRWYYIVYSQYVWFVAKRWPGLVRRKLTERLKEHVPKDFDVRTHFNPKYNPWEQVRCFSFYALFVSPNNKYFAAALRNS